MSAWRQKLVEMSYPLLRPWLFELEAETAHHWTLAGMRLGARCGLLAGDPPVVNPVEVCGLKFPNRVGLAAGMDKAGDAVDGFGALGFGFVEVGTLTPVAQPGNPAPRMFRVISRQGIINRMGFNNPGIEAGMANVKGRKYRSILGVNLGKNFFTPNERATDDYLAGLRGAWREADYVVVNLSSPNTKGLRDLQEAESARALIRALHAEQEILRQRWQKHVPIWIKIAPDLTTPQRESLTRVFMEERLEGVIATNTTLDRSNLSTDSTSLEGIGAGGVSGKALEKRSTEVIRYLHQQSGGAFPIVGVGGVFSAQDAIEKLEAGASLVQVYSGMIYEGPNLIKEIKKGLQLYFAK